MSYNYRELWVTRDMLSALTVIRRQAGDLTTDIKLTLLNILLNSILEFYRSVLKTWEITPDLIGET
jgi:hypothetical protein